MEKLGDFSDKVEARIHFYPWSVEIGKESRNLVEGKVDFPFFGSPVITLSEHAQLYLPSRMERFKSLGYVCDPDYQIYETPHGVFSRTAGSKELRIRSAKKVIQVRLNSHGAATRYLDKDKGADAPMESPIARCVIAWSQVFDDLLDRADIIQGAKTSEIKWHRVLELLKDMETELKKPRMSLIIRIAQDMRKQLPLTVSAVRRILLRTRELVPIHRIQESDPHCLRWFIRQPGETPAEKAGNKQKLLAVVRQETFNTLENQVLKDFMHRCRYEATRYLQSEVVFTRKYARSNRAIMVRGYKNICSDCLADPVFENVRKPDSSPHPNYVLQNDLRYKQVWSWYRKLLKHEDEEDSLWDWQPRTWADIMRLMVGTALEMLHEHSRDTGKKKKSILFEPLVNAPFRVTFEQEMGARLVAGSLPGPFLVTHLRSSGPDKRTVLELVHPDLALRHPIVRDLGRVGAHLYMVIHPLGSSKVQKKVIAFWSVNTAGTTKKVSVSAMALSAFKALQRHSLILAKRRSACPFLSGVIISSSLKEKGKLFFMNDKNKVPVLQVNADPRGWLSSVEDLASMMTGLVEQNHG